MNGGISKTLERLAAEYARATSQKERDRLARQIARTSYKEERARECARRLETGQGAFEALMLSLDALMDQFEDPGKIAVFSDGGVGAESIRADGEDAFVQAIAQLPEGDHAFALSVLDGKTWREMGIGKRGFNKRLAKICSRVGSHPPEKP